MSSPRVLFVTTSYPSSPVDRAGPFVHALARGLVQTGASVRVLAPAFGPTRGVARMDGVEVQRFQYLPARWQTLTMGYGGVPAAVRGAPWRLAQLPLMLVVAAGLAARAAREADLLHAHWLPNLLPCGPAARLRRLPRLVTLWGSDVEWFESAPRLRPAFRAVLRGADGVAVINEHMRTLFSQGQPTRQRLRLIPSGVDTELFRPQDRAAARERLHLPPHAVVALVVGSLIPRKGVDLAIEALAQAADDRITLVLVGDGEEHARLERLRDARALGARVRFAGNCSLAEVASWMAAADVFLLPSRYEGRPNVVLEAQASGLAVIASDIPGCRDLIEPGTTGLLVPPGDAPALAAALAAVATDSALRARLGECARAAILDGGYSWDACARQYREFYGEVMGA